MMDHRRYGGLPLQPELALCQILQEARHRWLRPTEVCEILRNYRKFKLTPDPPHKPQSGSLFLFDRKALRYFRKDGHNWRKKKDGKTVREAHERLKAGSIEVLHCYYAHGEENENFQRRSYWMLDTNEHIVLVHYREVKEGNRSGMRSPSSYSTDGGSSLGNSRVIASSSPQTSPLVSPRASSPNTSTDWNGHTYSPEYDDPESSDDTEQCFQQELERNVSPVAGGLAGAFVPNARNLHSCASFSAKSQNGVGYEEKQYASFHNVCSTTPMDQRVSGVGLAQGIPSKRENDIVVPPGGFDLLEWTELLKNGKRVVGRRSFEISDKEVVDSPNWADMLAQGTMQQDQKTADTLITSSMIDSSRHKDLTTSISEAPGSIQAPIQLPFHPQTHLQYITDSSEMLPNLSNNFHPIDMESLKATQLTDKQDSNIPHWSGILEQLSDNTNGQSGIFGGFESDFLNDTQQPQLQFMQPYDKDGQPFSPQHEPARFDVANNKEVFQAQSDPNVFKDFQADTPFLNETHDFKKLDSFGRWMNQEIVGDNEKSFITMSADSTCWATALDDQGTVGEVPSFVQQMQLDIGMIPLLPREQCFSITDFSPDNVLSGAESKVLVTGTFNDTVKDPSEFQWCCMFGEVEVPAEVLHSGVLRCRAPSHSPGRVPFYITRNDRVPCSDVREFEYRNELNVFSKESSAETLEGGHSKKKDMLFQIRLARMLSTRSHGRSLSQTLDEARDFNTNLDPLNCYDEWEQMEDDLTDSVCLLPSVKEQFIQNLLKEKLQTWLSEKLVEEGKGASVLDDHGLGVLHMGAALGYTWTIAPILAAGVSINFRDSRGMTALHWAAHCGREAMVVALLAAGAAPGVKTDPTNSFPDGQTPADLASIERHKGIAGYLAESSLTSHLSLLTLKSRMPGSISTGLPGNIAVETVSERTIVQPTVGGSEDQLSLQDSLAAVRNATQAAARIQSEFRVHSFRRKQESFQLQEDEYGFSNDEVRYIVAAQKPYRSGASYGEEEVSHSAAIRIQQKFRGWKGRRDFLLFRQHVVKIQAHVRGHQVRKHYRKILWSVGIVEKAILRWRRKGKGLRGFCADDSAKLRVADESWESDGDDFLKVGRKQTVAGLEKALARVQSMVRSPEARDQYRRLVESYQKAMVGDVTSPNSMNMEHIRYNGDFSMFVTDQ